MEKLEAVAILRKGHTFSYDNVRSHYELRCTMGDASPDFSQDGDVEGFVTNKGRFVTREEAKQIGVASGQLHPSWKMAKRTLLSSDVRW